MQENEKLSGQERGELEKKLSLWSSEGYRVDRLRELLAQGPGEARLAFETAERGIEKLREVALELKALDVPEDLDHVARLRTMLADPWASNEAESALVELQVQSEKRRKEAQRRKREEERRTASLRERFERWNAGGYAVGTLEEALAGGVEAAYERARLLEESIVQLGAAEEELRGLDTHGFEKERADIEGLLKRPDKVQQVEEAMLQLRVKIEKGRREKELRAGKEKDERARLAEKIRAWREAGLIISIGEAELERGELSVLQRVMHETEEAVIRIGELRNELQRMSGPEHDAELEELRRMLSEPSQVHAAEERMLRLQLRSERLRKDKEKKLQESQKRRGEIQERIKEWKDAGYDTSHLEAAASKDDETLKKELVMFRIQLRRLKELETELRALPSGGMEEEVARLLAKTRTVSLGAISALEAGIAALRMRLEDRREQLLREKENEKNEKQQLVDKLMGWVEKGYRDGEHVRLEVVISKDLPAIRHELESMEAKIGRIEPLRAELDALEAGSFEAEKAVVREMLLDLSRTAEAESHLQELKRKVERERAEAKRRAEEEKAKREEFRNRLIDWKGLGYNVTKLEAIMLGDLELIRKEFALAHMKIRRAEEMREELAALKADEFEKETVEILEDMPDLEKIPLNERRMESLKALVSERSAEVKKRADLRSRMEEWRAQGYDPRRLEEALKQDIDTATKEFLMFRIRVQKLRELGEELRSLDITGFEEEAGRIQADLRNVDAAPEMRARLSELELKIGKRMSEAVRGNEEKKKLKEECMAKMSSWMAEGFFVDELQDALGKDGAEMSARFAKFEEGVNMARQLLEKLKQLDAPGFEEMGASIREKLRDVAKLDEARRDVHELWVQIEKRLRESQNRKNEENGLREGLVRQVEAWRTQGHEVAHLESLSQGRVEHLRMAVLDFRIQLERRKDLHDILAALDVRGFEQEAARIRDMMRDLGGIEEAAAALEKLRADMKQRKEADLRERERLQRMRDSCTDRIMELLNGGYNIEGLENSLELPVLELARECERVNAIVGRLKQIEGEVHRLGLSEGDEAVLSKLKDIKALPHLEEWLSQKAGAGAPAAKPGRAQATPVHAPGPVPAQGGAAARRDGGPGATAVGVAAGEGTAPQARPGHGDEREQRREEPGQKKDSAIQPEKLEALRRKLGELKASGHDVSELETYLATETITADGMRTRLEALNRRIKQGRPPGAAGDTASQVEVPPAGRTSEPALAETPMVESRPTAGGSPPDDGDAGEPPVGAAEDEYEGSEEPDEGERAPGAPMAAGEPVRKLKKVKKVAR